MVHNAFVAGVMLLLVLGAAPRATGKASGKGAAPAAVEEAAEGWPETRAGSLARGWVTAFSAGEAEMKAFLAKQLAPKSLETMTLPKRIERYRGLREKYGRLEFASVVESRPEKLTVRLMDSDAAVHEFVFTVQGEAPYKLVSIGIRQRGHGFGH